jgi:hypothetical protein
MHVLNCAVAELALAATRAAGLEEHSRCARDRYTLEVHGFIDVYS